MKASKVLVFILGVFSLLAAGWIMYPAGGINVGGMNLRFASYRKALEDANEKKVDVDALVQALEEGFHRGDDTLEYYKNFFANNTPKKRLRKYLVAILSIKILVTKKFLCYYIFQGRELLECARTLVMSNLHTLQGIRFESADGELYQSISNRNRT